jgi:putative hemolysin
MEMQSYWKMGRVILEFPECPEFSRKWIVMTQPVFPHRWISPLKVQTDRDNSVKFYPTRSEKIPLDVIESGNYTLRFARDSADLDKICKLRYEVYNLEMGEGLVASEITGRDEDAFDPQCHHLVVELRRTAEVVGTYRLQTFPQQGREGFYTGQEFDLGGISDIDLLDAVEVGRACIARAHRNGRVLQLLWKGIARYLAWNGKRFLFGCCSLASTDPAQGWALFELLQKEGQLHPHYFTPAKPTFALPEGSPADECPELPRLLQGYLNLGAHICGTPALDLAFSTIDFLVWLDVEAMLPNLSRRFFA